MDKNIELNKLVELGKQIHTLRGILALLSWDQETYMPQDGANPRSMQIELMASITHNAETSKKFANELNKKIDLKSGEILIKNPTIEEEVVLRQWREHYLDLKKLPNKFVKSFAKLSSEAIFAWSHAKKNNSFEQFVPYLEKIIKMSQKKAKLLGYTDHPYDALIHQHEPFMTKKKLDKLFGDLKEPLKNLLNYIQKKPKPNNFFLEGSYSDDDQITASKYFLEEVGFDFKKGRLDLSTHPFSTTFHPHDSRITTRLDPKNFMHNIGSTLHEAGHALYEMGLNPNYFGSPLCEAVSLGVHESQSRFWETRIGQSKAFCKAYLPYFTKLFNLTKVSSDEFYKAVNLVEPNLIRVESDEVTYSFHVILRYEIECALLEGTLKAKDVQQAWSDKMEEYLGITPKTFSEGCLQDVHWAMGEFGYFPTYTLGNLYAAHFFQGFEYANPNWQELIENKNLKFIKQWLNENIHQYGKLYKAEELVERAAQNKPFSAKAYIDYLEKKYKEIY